MRRISLYVYLLIIIFIFNFNSILANPADKKEAEAESFIPIGPKVYGEKNVPYGYHMLHSDELDEVLLSEDFEAGLPVDWTVVDGGDNVGDSWYLCEENIGFGLLANCMFVDSHGHGFNVHQEESLITPVFSTENYSFIFLTFDQFYYYNESSYITIDYSTDNGSSWENLETHVFSVIGNPTVLDISECAGNPSIQIRFYYNDNGSHLSRWAIDNILVEGYNGDVYGPEITIISSPEYGWNLHEEEIIASASDPSGVASINLTYGYWNVSNNTINNQTTIPMISTGNIDEYSCIIPGDFNVTGNTVLWSIYALDASASSNASRLPEHPSQFPEDPSRWFGYPVNDPEYHYEWSETEYIWVDISATGTQVAIGDDTNDRIEFVDYGINETFRYYGIEYTGVNVCSNGWIAFDAATTSYHCHQMPGEDSPNSTLALCYDDLHGADNDALILVDAVDNQFVISYIGVPFLSQTPTITAQIVLDFSTDLIYFNYSNIEQVNYSGSHSIGIENETGEIGVSVYYGSEFSFPTNESSIVFDHVFYGIEGIVTDSFDQSQISNAEINVYYDDTTELVGSDISDIDGSYHVYLPPGTFDIFINAEDCVPFELQNFIVENYEAYNLNFELTNITHSGIDGCITDIETGIPIEGAEISLYDSETHDILNTATTENGGLYCIYSLEGTYDLGIYADEYYPIYLENIIIDEFTFTDISIPLVANQSLFSVSGQVNSLDSPEQFIEGITVQMFNQNGDLVGSTVTDNAGFYELGDNNISQGMYDFYLAFDPVGINGYHDASYDGIFVDGQNPVNLGVFEILPPANVTALGFDQIIFLQWEFPANAFEVTQNMIATLSSQAICKNNDKANYYSQRLRYYEALYQQQSELDDLRDITNFVIVDQDDNTYTTPSTTTGYQTVIEGNAEDRSFAVAADYGYGEEYLVFSDMVDVLIPELICNFVDHDFQWFDVRNNPEVFALELGDEDEAWIDFQPFLPPFFNQYSVGLTIGANGAVSFVQNEEIGYEPISLPNPDAPRGMIAPFWTDLDPSVGTEYDVFTVFDESGNLWIEWYAPYYGTDEIVNFELKLDFTSGTILFQFNNADSWDQQAIVGVQDFDGEDGFMWNIDNVENETAVEIQFELVTVGEIDGYVYDCAGNVVPDVNVMFNNSILTTTDENGYYLTSIPGGIHNIIFSHPDFWEVSSTVNISEGIVNTLTDIELTYPAAEIDPVSIEIFNENYLVEFTGDYNIDFENSGCGILVYEIEIDYLSTPDAWESYEPFLSIIPTNNTIDISETENLILSFDTEGNSLHEFVEWGDCVEASLTVSGPHFENIDIPVVFVFGNSTPDNEDKLPDRYALHQNYPNPFNHLTKIDFDLIQSENVKLSIFNILGQRVLTVIDREMEAGYHSASFDATTLSSGIYFYSLETESFSSMKKMVFMK